MRFACFLFNLPVMFFPKFVYMTKNTPFFPILHVFAPLNDVRAYSAWSWKTTLITWIFGRAWYPLDIRVPPPGHGGESKPTEMVKNVNNGGDLRGGFKVTLRAAWMIPAYIINIVTNCYPSWNYVNFISLWEWTWRHASLHVHQCLNWAFL